MVTTPHITPCYLGLPMWSHSHWQQSVYQDKQQAHRLAHYAQVFNTVEGNTTFYATPKASSVNNWLDATHNDFRFTFKLPKTITHERKLLHCQPEMNAFFRALEPLHQRTGVWKIQLADHFGPASLPVLDQFLNQLPQGMSFGVEVRHKAFFAKGEHEKQLNRLLMQHHCSRIIMDTRAVFAAPPTSAAVIDAHQKKPKVPVHPIATNNHPVIRFVGGPDLQQNLQFFTNWLKPLPQWLNDGKTPYIFIHTPDNNAAPEQAIAIYQHLKQHVTQQMQLHLPEFSLPLLANKAAEAEQAQQSQLDLGI
ncbi:DUF72 domain-containing protein [Shewanella maritima]|uniref:DUF72 domain-containing protein n=1 Tax=Shewanella maritima TaxID=2520507 RepID=UPI0037365D2D